MYPYNGNSNFQDFSEFSLLGFAWPSFNFTLIVTSSAYWITKCTLTTAQFIYFPVSDTICTFRLHSCRACLYIYIHLYEECVIHIYHILYASKQVKLYLCHYQYYFCIKRHTLSRRHHHYIAFGTRYRFFFRSTFCLYIVYLYI